MLKVVSQEIKQSGRTWNQRTSKFFMSIGLIQTNADHSVFVRGNKRDLAIIALHVDNMLVLSYKNL